MNKSLALLRGNISYHRQVVLHLVPGGILPVLGESSSVRVVVLHDVELQDVPRRLRSLRVLELEAEGKLEQRTQRCK